MTREFPPVRRADGGRFVATLRDDPNCCGILVAGDSYGRPIWECDGLTHKDDDGELEACLRSFDRVGADSSSPAVAAPRPNFTMETGNE